MATTTYKHGVLNKVYANGDLDVLYPATTAADVSVSRESNGNIPSDVANMQTLANKFGSLAFKSSIAIGDIASGSRTDALSQSTAGVKLLDAKAGYDLNAKITTLENKNWIDDSSTTATDQAWSCKKLQDTLTTLNSNINGKAPSNHTHSYAASSHTHDDRYYTESEMDTKLNGKSDTHSHPYLNTANVANNLTTTSAGYALDARQGKALNDALAGKSSSEHTHDNRYYTKDFINYNMIVENVIVFGAKGLNYVFIPLKAGYLPVNVYNPDFNTYYLDHITDIAIQNQTLVVFYTRTFASDTNLTVRVIWTRQF